MKIFEKKTDELISYVNNPRNNDDSFYKVKIKSVMSLIGATTNGKFVNEFLYSNRPIKGD